MKLIHFLPAIVVCTAFLTPTVSFADEDDFSAAEKQTMLKEDLALAQMLSDFCPSIVADSSRLNVNLEALKNKSLVELTDFTEATLATDAEYQTLLKAAQDATSQISKDEQRSLCEDALNYSI